MVPQPKGVYGPPLPPIPLAMKMEEVMSRHHLYMVWYLRITRLYINRASAKMEILLATQLAVLNWFSEESYEYKFIKKAFEDVDEVDHIDVPANDEAANHTKIPDVGPSTSSTASVTRHRPALTLPSATETPVPPLKTQSDFPCHLSLPLTLDLPRGLPMLNSNATRKEVNVGRVQPNMLKSYKGCCSLEILIVNASGQFCGVAKMQITGSKIDGVGSKNMHLDIIGVI
ncbi:hypothetical protein SO802_033232 [Lithocarpus litseifolius]|uniref:Uncharacterized protein n=1 Tax=Lithocarpus litseifolius TaxID=425828 RepID=A0AAW2BF99_9ROSI